MPGSLISSTNDRVAPTRPTEAHSATMFTEVVVYVLTALAALVVVLTRLRLSGDESAGRLQISHRLLLAHTVAGTAAWLLWVVFLVLPMDNVLGNPTTGILALGLWWLTTIVGLLILVRWLPARGKHARPGSSDSWSKGPWLSVLAHIGLLVGVLVFTYAYVTATV